MQKRWLIIDGILLGTISLILYFNDIRICPFYNIFKIPCPGCGLTRGFIELAKFNFSKSLEYNILCIPIIVFSLLYIILIILKKEFIINNILNKYKVLVIISSFILVLIVFIININNPLLY